MSIKLPDLPYDKAALEPHISAKTLEFHYGKHHAGYVEKLNGLIKGTEWEKDSLENIIKKTAKDPSKSAIFNNAAQVWNHTFYWQCIKKNGGDMPEGNIANGIKEGFGSFEKFAEEFKNSGIAQFGSGWAWLVLKGKK